MQQQAEQATYAEARRVLRSIFVGIDPETHERLSPECVTMQPEVKVALGLAVEALQMAGWMQRSKRKAAAQPRTGSWQPPQPRGKAEPTKAGAAWSAVEDNRLRQEKQQGLSLSQMAVVHQRSRGAIEARLVHLDLLPGPRCGWPAKLVVR